MHDAIIERVCKPNTKSIGREGGPPLGRIKKGVTSQPVIPPRTGRAKESGHRYHCRHALLILPPYARSLLEKFDDNTFCYPHPKEKKNTHAPHLISGASGGG